MHDKVSGCCDSWEKSVLVFSQGKTGKIPQRLVEKTLG